MSSESLPKTRRQRVVALCNGTAFATIQLVPLTERLSYQYSSELRFRTSECYALVNKELYGGLIITLFWTSREAIYSGG